MRNRFLNSTTLVFVAIVALVAVWIGSGMIGREAPVEEERAAGQVPTVAVHLSRAEPITRELVLYGDVQPVQISVLRARTQGIVEEVVPIGREVEAGQEVGRLSTDDREASLARAEAQLAVAQRDFNTAQELFQRGTGPENAVQTALAQLEAARADVRAVELELANTVLRAPISGVVNEVMADVGAYVAGGGEVLEVIDNDPLLAVVQVQQSSIGFLQRGMPAHVRFIGGQESEGVVRFVAPIADAETRTFRVEVEIANEGAALPSGLSAEVVIPLETQPAHRVSAALGQLDEQGRLGVHVVDDDSRIAFLPVSILRARADGVWVAGLPEEVRLVTISQGSLSPGQVVEMRDTPPEYLDPPGAGAGMGAVEAVEEQIEASDPAEGP